MEPDVRDFMEKFLAMYWPTSLSFTSHRLEATEWAENIGGKFNVLMQWKLYVVLQVLQQQWPTYSLFFSLTLFLSAESEAKSDQQLLSNLRVFYNVA